MCGVVGLVSAATAAPQLATALFAMQHRGQDAAGMVTNSGGHLRLMKGLGQVAQALDPAQIATLPGTSGIGHVRYPTMGGSGLNETQPYLTRLGGLALAHNGNLTNTVQLRRHLAERGLHPLSDNDGELLLLLFADELSRRGGATSDAIVSESARAVMHLARGAFTVVATLQVDGADTVLCFRDPHGIRPAVYGSDERGSIVASESVALDALGFPTTAELPPGHAVLLRAGQAPAVYACSPAAPRRCVFEHVYFARPDSVLDGQRVNASRWRMGDELARAWAERGLQADVIVPIPDTSRPAAAAMSERLGIPNREGFIKNRYSGRTFIMPDDRSRAAALRLKLNPIREVFEGQRVMLVDDSVVRGSTMRRIASLVRTLGPREVHLAVFSPPVRHPCFYGIDMPTHAELIAHRAEEVGLEEWLCGHFGVDSVTYLPRPGLTRAVGSDVCAACFDGDYPVTVDRDEQTMIQQQRRPCNGAPAQG